MYADVWVSCEVVTDYLVHLHRGKCNVDKLGLIFDFRVRSKEKHVTRLKVEIENIMEQQISAKPA